MSAMVCELCGSNDIVKQDGLFVCQQCGAKYTLEEAKKLLGNVKTETTVRIDTTQELANLYQIARRAKADNNAENAAQYYDMIMVKDPTSWEAAFYVVYFKATECKIAQIRSAAISVNNCEDTVLYLIKNHVADDEQYDAVNEVLIRSQLIANMLAGGAKSHYDDIDSSIRSKYTQEYIDNVCAARDILYTCGTQIDSIFEDRPEIAKLAADAWKSGIELHERILPLLANQVANRGIMASYAEQIGKYDPEYAKDYLNEQNRKTYEEKKQALRNQISTLNSTIAATEHPRTVKSPGCMTFFVLLGLVAVIVGIVCSNLIESTALIVFEIVIGVLCILFGIFYNITKSSDKEKMRQRNVEAKEQLAKAEAELEALERDHKH